MYSQSSSRIIRRLISPDLSTLTTSLEPPFPPPVEAGAGTWTTVFDSAVSGEYVETLVGKTHTFTQRSVRYVRDYLNGSTANSGNHWTEIEVWGTATTAYVGDYFEWNGSIETMTRYYSAGGTRVAVRNSNGNGTNGLVYLFGDHLGSASVTADPLDGDKLSELRYKAWGETRHTLTNAPTDRRYTGQTEEMGLGLYYYGARFYDSALGRFVSPDSIIPGTENPLAWDRYAYTFNNPVRYNDPSGHCPWCIGGLVLGGIAGAVIYASTSLTSGRDMSAGGFLTSVGTGAVGGALIGTGVGAAAGVATFAAIGAGSGVIAGQFGYSVTAGDSFDSGDMIISAVASGVAGGITGAIGGSSIAGTGTAFAFDFAVNGVASAAQYSATQLSNGQPVNPAVALVNGLAGGVVGGAGDLLLGGSQIGGYAARWMAVANNPATRSSLSNASRMAIGGLAVSSLEQAPRAGVTNVITSYWQRQLAETR